MPRTRQVRLEPDVIDFLEHDPEHDGLSLSASTNRALRYAYRPSDDENEHPGTNGPEVSRVAAAVPRRALAGPRGRTGARVAPGMCRHPLARRVGDRCAACGSRV